MPSPLGQDLFQQLPCLLSPAIAGVVQEVEEEVKGVSGVGGVIGVGRVCANVILFTCKIVK